MDLLRIQLEVLERVAQRASVDDALEALCREAEQAIPGSICSVTRYDPATNTLQIRKSPCMRPDAIAQFNGLVPGELAGSCGAAAFERRRVIVSDTLTDPRWKALAGFAREFGVRSCWSIPFFDGAGEVLGTFSVAQGVPSEPGEDQLRLLETAGHLAGIAFERDRTERELKAQRQLLDSLVASTEDPVFAKDTEGRYLALNEATAASAGLTVEEMLGRTDDVFFPPDVAQRFQEVDRMVLESGEGVLVEGIVEHPNIGRRRYSTRKSPLRSPEGDIIGVVGIARDVTELRAAEEAVQQSQKLESLGVLAGGIAHDFNNLLTGILGNAELAQMQVDIGSPVGVNLRRIQSAAERAAELISQMLAYSGRGESQKTEFQLPQLVEDLRALLATSISKKAELRFEFEPDLPPVVGDVTQIRQLLMNLILNASEALGDEPGHIDVSVRRCPRELLVPQRQDGLRSPCYLEIRVSDDGIGMDEPTAARIYDPFFTTKFTGRGLGLAAVQGIVVAHEGRIDVESSPGGGTTFTILLPASESAPTDGGAVAKPEPGAPATGHTVLVVDDEEVVRDVAGEALENAGFRALLASNGDEAIGLLKARSAEVSAILLDLTTPGLSGRAAFEQLRLLRPEVPILLASGFEEREATGDFAPGELAGYVKKPFRPSKVVEAIRGCIGALPTR